MYAPVCVFFIFPGIQILQRIPPNARARASHVVKRLRAWDCACAQTRSETPEMRINLRVCAVTFQLIVCVHAQARAKMRIIKTHTLASLLLLRPGSGAQPDQQRDRGSAGRRRDPRPSSLRRNRRRAHRQNGCFFCLSNPRTRSSGQRVYARDLSK